MYVDVFRPNFLVLTRGVIQVRFDPQNLALRFSDSKLLNYTRLLVYTSLYFWQRQEMKKINKIILAYSGGLDTSAMLLWLKETYGCEVVCYCADVGQGEELTGLEEKAKATGASKLYVEDLREEFVKDFVWMAVKANALYEGVYLLGTSRARPVIAKRQIEIAQKEGADAVAHGATGKGNDQVRFELTYYALQPDIKVVAPWREWEFKGRADLIAYCAKHGIHVTAA